MKRPITMVAVKNRPTNFPIHSELHIAVILGLHIRKFQYYIMLLFTLLSIVIDKLNNFILNYFNYETILRKTVRNEQEWDRLCSPTSQTDKQIKLHKDCYCKNNIHKEQ